MGMGAFLFVRPSAPPLHFRAPLHSALPLRPPHFICGIQAPHSLVNQQSRFPHDQEFIQSAILHFFDMQTRSEIVFCFLHQLEWVHDGHGISIYRLNQGRKDLAPLIKPVR